MLGYRQRIWLGFTGMSALLVVLGAVGLSLVAFNRRSMERIMRENHDTITACRTMNAIATRMVLEAQRGAGTDELAGLAPAFEKHLRFQQGNLTLEGEAEVTARLASAWKEFRFIAEHVQGGNRESKERLMLAYDPVQETTHALMEMNLRNIVSIHGQVSQVAERNRMQLVALSTLGVVLGAILALCVGRSLQRPIMDLFDYVERTGQVPAQSLEAQHIRRQTKEGPRWFETSALKLENEEGTFDGLALIATPLRETTG